MNENSYYKILTAKGDGGIASIQIFSKNISRKIFNIFSPFNSKRKISAGEFSYGKIKQNDFEIDEAILSINDIDNIEIHVHGGSMSLKKICKTIENELKINNQNVHIYDLGKNSFWESFSEIESAKELEQFLTQTKNLFLWLSTIHDKNEDSTLSDVKNILKAWPRVCHHKRRALVCMAGLPNAGKSSLMNNVSGKKRALVNKEEKTTRDTITENFTFNGHRFKLIDTAGLHDPDNSLDLASINQTWKYIGLSELILWLHDTQKDISEEEVQFINEIKTKNPNKEVWIISTKIDLLDNSKPNNSKYKFSISSDTNIGVNELLMLVCSTLFEESNLNLAPLSQKMADELEYLVREVDLNPSQFTILSLYLQNLFATIKGYLHG